MKLETWAVLTLSLGLVLSSTACGKGSGEHGKSGTHAPSESAVANAGPAIVSAAPSAASAPTPPPPKCRVLRVVGDATFGAAALTSNAQFDGSAWVTLAKDASLTVIHPTSGRELSLAGPALFRACRHGREQLLLARGVVTVGTGAGSRPGAEVLIATPVGAVRYADADFTLELDDKKLNVGVRAGQVEFDAAPTAGNQAKKSPKKFKSPLHAKDNLVVPLGKPDPVQLMATCKAEAELAVETARKVGDRGAPEPLGERAQANVRARRAARLACTIAAASIGLVAEPTAASGLWADAARWEGLWEIRPQLIPAQPPEK